MKEKIEKIISRTNLKKALNELSKEAHLVAPVSLYGETVFQEVESVDDIVFDYENCLNAPKDYMLLNDETLFKYDLKKSKILKKSYKFPQIVIFGSRPCDTRAAGFLDKFFSRKFEDPLYFAKRGNVFIITLACQKLGRNCFCTSTHTGPYLEKGFDIQLVDIDKGYYLEASSSKGEDFVRRFSDLMGNVNNDKKIQREKAVKKAINSKDKDFDFKKVYENLDNGKVKSELWEDLSQRCQSCGGCLLICPTCSCFYVTDKNINDREAQRVRSLDACYYDGFTRMAGPYNPIRSAEMMMKRKFYHKLHQQINEFDEPGCTGCGRCNQICPGNINWLNVIKKISR